MLNEKRNIVVVDDEKDITALYRENLEPYYNVMEFNDPEEFLKFLKFHQTTPFHALVSDFKMPRLNGLQMIQKAFEMGYSFPFVMLSGHLDKETVIKAVNYGAFRLLEKPTTSEDLLEALDQIVIEHEIHLTRDQIRKMMGQLRENYTFLRTILTNYVPDSELSKMIVQTDQKGQVVGEQNFDGLVSDIENRLDELMSTEETLEMLRKKSAQKPAA